MPNRYNTNTRRFTTDNPVLYNGQYYPSTTMPVDDGAGNIQDTTVFADRSGNYFNQTGTPVMLQQALPEVNVLARKRERGLTDGASDYIITPEEVDEINNRKAILRAAGYDVPKDNFWDANQQALWDKLTTKQKDYDTTFTGLADGLWDKLTSNDTFFTDPMSQGEIKEYNPDEVDKVKTARSNNPIANAIGGTYMPGFLALYGGSKGLQFLSNPIANSKAIYNGISNILHSPITSVGSIAGATLGGAAGNATVNATSKAITGEDWNTLAQENLGLSPMVAEFANPGSYGIGYLGSKWLTDVERRALEVAMRTSMGAANPIPSLSRGWKSADKAKKGAVVKYILGNSKTKGKDKGYYASLSPGPGYYQGFNANVYSYKPTTDGNDMIDAYLYGKTIDPKFGIKKLSTTDAGMHTSYIKEKYPNKEIPIYEQEVDPSIVNIINHDTKNINWDTPIGQKETGFIFNNDNIIGNGVDVGGHLLRKGQLPNGANVLQEQDIWKFNPTDYKNKWVDNPYVKFNGREKIKNKIKTGLMQFGLRETDVLGTPIITRTPIYKF